MHQLTVRELVWVDSSAFQLMSSRHLIASPNENNWGSSTQLVTFGSLGAVQMGTRCSCVRVSW